jgi:outer membrane cobalamin receptor
MKGKITLGIILSGLCIGFTSGQSMAATTDQEVYDLGKVVVTKTADKGVQASETIHTVTANQIREQHARTLDEALALLPGLSIRTGGDGIPRIDIRGFRTRHVLLLLNGTPFNASSDGQFDPSLISVENIAEIKVITGGSSILYGPGGNGGVINIITKKGKTGVHGSLAAETASGNSNLVKGAVSGGSDKIDYFVSGSAYIRDNFPLSDDFAPTKYEDGGARENSDLRRDNAFANLSYSPSEKTVFGVTLSYLKGDQGKPPVVNYDKNDPFSSNIKYERETNSENTSLQLAASHDLEGPFRIKGWVFLNQLKLRDDRYDDGNYDTQLLKGSSRTDSTTRISGANLQVAYEPNANNTFTFGLMSENDDWDADGFQQVQSKKSSSATRQYFDDSHDFQLYSTLLQYEATVGKQVGLVLGAGYHWQDREDDRKQDYSYVIGAHYDPFPQTRLKASHARKIRFPSLSDLYDPDSGNSGLTPEISKHYEAGIEQGLPVKTSASFTVFHDDIDNFIEKDADEISRNFEKYVFNGFEVSLENKVIDNLVVRAAYTFLDTKDKSTGSQRDELQYRPGDKFTVDAVYRFPWGTSLYASVMYLANQYYYDKNQVEKRRLPNYTVVDLKLSQNLYQDELNLYVGAKNLLDENYEQSYGLPQAGRLIYGGLEYRF